MNLKEAFRYKHLLNEWATTALITAQSSQALYNTSEHHLKQETIQTEKNETIVVKPARKYDVDAGQLIAFSKIVLDEYEKLSAEIDRAMSIKFDDYKSLLDTTRLIRSMADYYQRLAQAKPSETRSKDTATYVNADGNAVQYTYTVVHEMTPTFDTEALEADVKDMLDAADKASADIEKALVNVELENFTPRFSVNDTLQSAIRSVTK